MDAGRPLREPIEPLTEREREVLELLRAGLTNEEIARRLDISLDGAKYHVSEVIGKLGVRNRREAAAWPRRPPWWLAGLAPPFFWRRVNAGWPSRALAVAAFAAVAAGLGLLAWGLLRANDGATTAAIVPSATVADLLGCYRESSNTDNALPATLGLAGATVSLGGRQLRDEDATKLLSIVVGVEPVYFGVRGTPGTRIGEPGRLVETPVRIELLAGDLTLMYVRPGPVAPFGLLFDPALINSWEYVTLLSPPGYAQLACTVPPQFDNLMATLGFAGYEPTDILETRAVSLNEAQRDTAIDRIEVVPPGSGWAVVLPWLKDGELGAASSAQPVRPFEGEPLHVRVLYRGVDPFPEAVEPAEYAYYPGDGSGSTTGVLLQTTPAVVYNSTLGTTDDQPFFAAPALNARLRALLSGR